MSKKAETDLEKEQQAIIKKLKAKLKPTPSFVDTNTAQFDKLIEDLHKSFIHKNNKGKEVSRYFFTRPPKKSGGEDEVCFKLNVFVQDLIEYKAKMNDPDNAPARISMDKGSLINVLLKDRKVRKADNQDSAALKKEISKLKKQVGSLEAQLENAVNALEQETGREPNSSLAPDIQVGIDPKYLETGQLEPPQANTEEIVLPKASPEPTKKRGGQGKGRFQGEGDIAPPSFG